MIHYALSTNEIDVCPLNRLIADKTDETDETDEIIKQIVAEETDDEINDFR